MGDGRGPCRIYCVIPLPEIRKHFLAVVLAALSQTPCISVAGRALGNAFLKGMEVACSSCSVLPDTLDAKGFHLE